MQVLVRCILKSHAIKLFDSLSIAIGLKSYIMSLINKEISQASFIDRERSTALCFHIFGSVHAMKTEIPPFDSEIKDLTNSSL